MHWLIIILFPIALLIFSSGEESRLVDKFGTYNDLLKKLKRLDKKKAMELEDKHQPDLDYIDKTAGDGYFQSKKYNKQMDKFIKELQEELTSSL